MDSGISYLSEDSAAAGRLDRRAPVLIAASGESARDRAVATVEAAGLRAAVVALDQAGQRLALQGAASDLAGT